MLNLLVCFNSSKFNQKFKILNQFFSLLGQIFKKFLDRSNHDWKNFNMIYHSFDVDDYPRNLVLLKKQISFACSPYSLEITRKVKNITLVFFRHWDNFLDFFCRFIHNWKGFNIFY